MSYSGIPTRTSTDPNSFTDINQIQDNIDFVINGTTSTAAPADSLVSLRTAIDGSSGGAGSGVVFKHLRSISTQDFINGNNDFQIYESTLAEATTDTDKISIILTKEGTLATLETFIATITSIVVDTVNTFNSGSEVTLSASDIYDSTGNEFLVADISSLSWDGDSDLYCRIVCNAATSDVGSQIWLDFQNSFSLKLVQLPNYETAWINNSDWSDRHLGTAAGGNLVHNLGAPVEDLLVKVFIDQTTDGSSGEHREMLWASNEGSSTQQGISIIAVDDNNVIVQTGTGGVRFIENNGVATEMLAQNWSYKVIAYRLR